MCPDSAREEQPQRQKHERQSGGVHQSMPMSAMAGQLPKMEGEDHTQALCISLVCCCIIMCSACYLFMGFKKTV